MTPANHILHHNLNISTLRIQVGLSLCLAHNDNILTKIHTTEPRTRTTITRTHITAVVRHLHNLTIAASTLAQHQQLAAHPRRTTTDDPVHLPPKAEVMPLAQHQPMLLGIPCRNRTAAGDTQGTDHMVDRHELEDPLGHYHPMDESRRKGEKIRDGTLCRHFCSAATFFEVHFEAAWL